MILQIETTHVPTHDEWTQVWQACPYATFFQSPLWAEIWSEYTSRRVVPDPLVLAFSDGMEILLPFSREKILKGAAARHVSSPAGTFGGWLGPASLDRAHQETALAFMDRTYPDLVMRTNPYEPLLTENVPGLVTADETMALDLSRGFEAVYRRGHASVAARHAERAGVQTGMADIRSDWQAYYEIYQDSLERWGDGATQAYPWRLFEILSGLSSPDVRLWLARYQGQVVAGALCFYAPHHVVYWHGAALASHFHLRPVNLLMYAAIRDASERGAAWFDFNPSGGLEGVRAFKRSFGAQPLRSDVLRKTSTKVRLLSGAAGMLRPARGNG